MFLKIKNDSCPEFLKCINLCEIFNYGTSQVYALLENSGKIIKLGNNVKINDIFVMMLKRYIGDKNVVIKEVKND